MLAIRARRMRRAVPSLLMVIFVIAVTTILFFPDLDVTSFASQTGELAAQKVFDTENALLRHTNQEDTASRIPPPVEPESEVIESDLALASDDPLIASIDKLRRDFADNYQTE